MSATKIVVAVVTLVTALTTVAKTTRLRWLRLSLGFIGDEAAVAATLWRRWFFGCGKNDFDGGFSGGGGGGNAVERESHQGDLEK